MPYFRVAVLTIILTLTPVLSSMGQTKSMVRAEDPIVVKGSVLDPLLNTEIKTLSLLKYENGEFQPVPFQVDERTRDGKLVYTLGPGNNAGDGNGLLSGEDELVFMIWDTGDKAPADAALPPGALEGLELVLTDPNDQGKAWVYLVPFGDSPPRSDVDYVKHDSDGTRNWVKAQRYRFGEQIGESYFDRLAISGKDGKIGPDISDRIKSRWEVSVMWGTVDMTFSEETAKVKMEMWIDGPVRVIHNMEGYVKVAVLKIEAGGGAENLFYPNYFVTPIYMDIPFNPDTIATDFGINYTIDFNKHANGMTYLDQVNTQGVTLDGKMSPAEKKLDAESTRNWWALTGDQGNIVVRAILDPAWGKGVKLQQYYVDDIAQLDPPEEDPGQRRAGFAFANIKGIDKGSYQYFLHYRFPADPVTEARGNALMDVLDKPVKVKAGPLPSAR